MKTQDQIEAEYQNLGTENHWTTLADFPPHRIRCLNAGHSTTRFWTSESGTVEKWCCHTCRIFWRSDGS